MTNNTQGAHVPAVFSFESHAVRTYSDDHSEPWFCATDVCDALGYQNSRPTIQKHCKEKGVSKRYTPTESGNQEMTFINEPNLYRLIIKSRKPEAERFEVWLMEEVLPSIRKTGRYQAKNSHAKLEASMPTLAIAASSGRYVVEVDDQQRCRVISRIPDDSILMSESTTRGIIEMLSLSASGLKVVADEMRQQLSN